MSAEMEYLPAALSLVAGYLEHRRQVQREKQRQAVQSTVQDTLAALKERQEVRVPTLFQSETELLACLSRADLTTERVGGTLVTQAEGLPPVAWQQVSGVWTAVVTQRDLAGLQQVIDTLEKTAGREVITVPITGTARDSLTFPTPFRDKELLQKTLAQQGVHLQEYADGTWGCLMDDVHLTFQRDDDGTFVMKVSGPAELLGAMARLDLLSQDYRKQVQTDTCRKLKDRLQQNNMTLEHEEVLADDTILLTLTLDG